MPSKIWRFIRVFVRKSGLAAAMLACWAAVAFSGCGQPVAGPNQSAIRTELHQALLRVGAVPSGSRQARAAAEIELSNRLARDIPASLALYFSLPPRPEKRLLLHLMSLTGRPEFLAAAHSALDEGPPELILAALRATVILDHPASRDRIRPFLRSPHPRRVILALRYFGAKPGDGAVRSLAAEDGAVRNLAARDDAVRNLAAGDLAPLLTHGHAGVQRALLGVLAGRSEAAFRAHCARALRHRADAVRLAAVRCVGRSARPEAAADLAAIFPGASEPIQIAVIHEFARPRSAGRFARLAGWIGAQRPRVAMAALVALQRLNDRRAVPILISAIRSGGGAIPRRVLIKSLGLYRDPRAVPFLGGLLAGDGVEPEREVIIEAIGDSGLLEGQAHLLPYLASYDGALRQAARQALRAIATRNARAGK